MASIAITFTHPQASFTRTATIPDAQLVRLVSAYKTIYGQVSDGAGGMRDMTNAETLSKLWQGTLDGWRDAVKRAEQDAAAKTASDAVNPIVVT